MKPSVLILFTSGTNRELDLARAFELAGANPEIVPINLIKNGKKKFQNYQILAIPGGFSYADALGAGKLIALDLTAYFSDEVTRFVESGKPVIGICNGFQALIKSGILPGGKPKSLKKEMTLTFNSYGHFECRWIYIMPVSKSCLWTNGVVSPIYCPVAHGEGNFLTASAETLSKLHANEQIALRYVFDDGRQADGFYPVNPNGSAADIAGICNPQGNVLGLMPHPENHIYPYQHPGRTRGANTGSGLTLFKNCVNYCSN